MSKDITFHINNMTYTITVDEKMEKELTKFINPEDNNDTRNLLAAYLRITQEYLTLKNDVQEITDKLSKF